MNINQAMIDPQLFGDHFSGPTWDNWRHLLAGFYGLMLDASALEAWEAVTGRTEPPPAPFDELWLVIGRRGGKSQTAALLAVFEAFFFDHSDKLAPGEIATVLVVSPTQKQSRTVMRYIRGLIEACPMLQAMVVRDQAESIELSNRCCIEVMTASHRTIRGYTVSAAILDEIAFWHHEGANPDKEILAAIRPSMATLGGKLIALSSPYARRGVLWEAYRRHFKQPGRVLVAQAPTALMNPSLPQHVIDAAYLADPAAAAAEYGAMFRTDVEAFITREALEAVTIPDRRELPFSSARKYQAFVDPSGGSQDAFTLAIGHREGQSKTVVVDALRSVRPPFSPESVVSEFCELLKSYRVREVTGDNYAGEWPKEQFSKRGITYKRAEQVKSDLYRDFLPLVNSCQVELPDHRGLMNELANLERRTARGGRDRIDHAPGQHDDIANAVAGLCVILARKREILPLFTDIPTAY